MNSDKQDILVSSKVIKILPTKLITHLGNKSTLRDAHTCISTARDVQSAMNARTLLFAYFEDPEL